MSTAWHLFGASLSALALLTACGDDSLTAGAGAGGNTDGAGGAGGVEQGGGGMGGSSGDGASAGHGGGVPQSECGDGRLDPEEVCFAPAAADSFSAAGSARSLRAADCSGDGFADLILLDGAGDRIVAFVNDQAGGFGSPVPSPALQCAGADSMAVGDFSGEGDLSAAYPCGDEIRFALAGREGCTFLPPPPPKFTPGTAPFHDVARIRQADGEPDQVLFFETYVFESLYFRGTTGGGLINYQETDDGPIFAGDVNDDGVEDATYLRPSARAIGIHLRETDGFADLVQTPVGEQLVEGAAALAIAPLDDSAGNEIVVAGLSALSVLHNDGGEAFIHAPHRPYAAGDGGPTGAVGLALGDIDGDGDNDAVVLTRGDDQDVSAALVFLFNDGNGALESSPVTLPAEDNPSDLNLVDLDGNDTLDVVYVSSFQTGESTVHVLLATP